MNYAALFGSAGGGAAAGGWSTAITASKSITFTARGTVVLSTVGAGGGGAANVGGSGAASGGNSAPWGRKKFSVVPGDVLVVTLAAGGSKAASSGQAGSQGGTTTVKLNGVTILTVQGGEGGVYVAGAGPAQPISPAATVTGADYWVPGVRAGSASGGDSQSGGAAVDVLGNGLGKSPNSTSYVGVGGSVGTDSGGVSLAWLALTDFGISITDPSQANASVGAPGRGADGTVLAGAFGGGSTNDSYRATAGIGAGGGAGSSVAVGTGGCGPGGKAYAYLCFAPEA